MKHWGFLLVSLDFGGDACINQARFQGDLQLFVHLDEVVGRG